MKRIALSGDNGRGLSALVDDEDYETIKHYRWCLKRGKNGVLYARTHYWSKADKKVKTILMHRLIMRARPKTIIDHKNHNGLDNRKDNLRLCTPADNNRNNKKGKGTFRYKGIAKRKNRNVYQAQIRFDNKPIYLGCWTLLEDAARAYDLAAHVLFGPYAYRNLAKNDLWDARHADKIIGLIDRALL